MNRNITGCVHTGFDAAAGDPVGTYKVTPGTFGLMIKVSGEGSVFICDTIIPQELRRLMGGDNLVLSLEGGYDHGANRACSVQCARALLGYPLDEPK